MGLAVLNAQKTASTVTLTQGLSRRIIETFDEGAALLAGRGMSRLRLDISSSVRFGGPTLCERVSTSSSSVPESRYFPGVANLIPRYYVFRYKFISGSPSRDGYNSIAHTGMKSKKILIYVNLLQRLALVPSGSTIEAAALALKFPPILWTKVGFNIELEVFGTVKFIPIPLLFMICVFDKSRFTVFDSLCIPSRPQL